MNITDSLIHLAGSYTLQAPYTGPAYCGAAGRVVLSRFSATCDACLGRWAVHNAAIVRMVMGHRS